MGYGGCFSSGAHSSEEEFGGCLSRVKVFAISVAEELTKGVDAFVAEGTISAVVFVGFVQTVG